MTPFPTHIYSDTADRDKVIMHGALRELGGFEIDVRWELMQRDAFGNNSINRSASQRDLSLNKYGDDYY